MRITERDVEIVKAVYEYRAMTIRQVLLLLFPPDDPEKGPEAKLSVCKRRLHLLWQNRFLERVVLPVVPLQGAPRVIHLLGERGATLLASELGIDRGAIGWTSERNKVTLTFLEHTLKINDFRVAITVAARRRGDEISEWIGEAELKALRERVDDPRDRDKHPEKRRKIPVAPDGYFVYRRADRPERPGYFFLEVDMATMANRRWAAKIRGYIGYTSKNAEGDSPYSRRYNTHRLRVLTVTTSERRLRNLKATTERVGGKSRFWFTTFEHLTPEAILGPVWAVAGRETGERVSLLE